MLHREHSAILSTFIELPFVIKIFVLSIFEWSLKTGFTVITIRINYMFYGCSTSALHIHETELYTTMTNKTITWFGLFKKPKHSRFIQNCLLSNYPRYINPAQRYCGISGSQFSLSTGSGINMVAGKCFILLALAASSLEMSTSNCGDIAELEEQMRGFREQQKQNQATRELLQQKIAALEQELEPEEGK